MWHMTRWVGSYHSRHHSDKYVDRAPCESIDKIFLICHVTHNRSVMRLCNWVSLVYSHHPVKFGVHRPCESGDITFFVTT